MSAAIGRRAGLCLLGFAALSGLLVGWAPLQRLDETLQDQFLRLMPPLMQAASDVVIVDIDEDSLAHLGPWPWPRPVLTRLAQTLAEQGATVQIWDMVLPDSRPGDAELTQTFGQSSTPAVVGQILGLDDSVRNMPDTGRLLGTPGAGLPCSAHPPVAGFLGNAPSLGIRYAGHITAQPDLDGVMRRVPAVICDRDQAYAQLIIAGAQAASPGEPWAYQPPAWWQAAGQLRLGQLSFALDRQGYLKVPYTRPHTAWPAISAYQLLDPAAARLPLRGKWVLVGATAFGLSDAVSTPYHAVAPGVSVHAELLSAALSGRWQAGWLAAPWASMLLVLGVGGLWSLGQRAWAGGDKGWPMRSLSLAWPLGLVLLMAYLARLWGQPLPVVAPLLGMLGLQGAHLWSRIDHERQNAARLGEHLASFLPAPLARQIATQHPRGESLGHPCDGVLLAVRVGGLARWSFQVDTLQALGLMHGLSSLVESIAREHGGRLEYVQGATFWVAWPDPVAGRQAVRAGQQMVHQLQVVLDRNELEHHPLSARCVVDQGAYLHGLVGQADSRHSLLLGPATERLLGMLELVDELACEVLVGPELGQALAAQPTAARWVANLGEFWLPDARQAVALYRALPAGVEPA